MGLFRRKTAEEHFLKGNAHLGAFREAEAIAAFKKAIDLKPDYADAYARMGKAYFRLENYADALTAYKQVVALDPDYTEVYCQMALAYHSFNQAPEAITLFKKYLALEPTGEDAAFARVYLRANGVRGPIGR